MSFESVDSDQPRGGIVNFASRRIVPMPRRLSAAFRRTMASSTQVWWQLGCAAVVIAYCASLIFVRRPASGYLTFWDGCVGDIAATLPIVPALPRVRHTSRLQ